MLQPKCICHQDVNATTIKFLVVDDDQVSVMAIKRALKKLEIVNPVYVAKDGVEALEILRGTAEVNQIVPPFIITLDINMPRMNGLELLEQIRADPNLQDAIIFMLTTSDAKSDIEQAFCKNVTGYILKDSMNSSLSDALKMIDDYSKLSVLPV